jgi:hypothetical protein
VSVAYYVDLHAEETKERMERKRRTE